jgi:hypothetical protein
MIQQGDELCPMCRTNLFRKEMKMKEVYEAVKDRLFNFDMFCYIMNTIDMEDNFIDLTKARNHITDFDKYDDDSKSINNEDDYNKHRHLENVENIIYSAFDL